MRSHCDLFKVWTSTLNVQKQSWDGKSWRFSGQHSLFLENEDYKLCSAKYSVGRNSCNSLLTLGLIECHCLPLNATQKLWMVFSFGMVSKEETFHSQNSVLGHSSRSSSYRSTKVATSLSSIFSKSFETWILVVSSKLSFRILVISLSNPFSFRLNGLVLKENSPPLWMTELSSFHSMCEQFNSIRTFERSKNLDQTWNFQVESIQAWSRKLINLKKKFTILSAMVCFLCNPINYKLVYEWYSQYESFS